jgi:hypothetical protein
MFYDELLCLNNCVQEGGGKMSLIVNIGVISQSALVSFKDLTIVAAALQKQVGYWPLVIRDDIGYDAAGIHLDNDGQPFALVSSSGERDVWALTASHEVLEMLADPFGNRVVAGDSPKPGQGRVMFLVEVCDPSEAAEFGYSVNGVLVSDFYTPNYFDPVSNSATRYSFTNSLQRPRQVLQGGYLSWEDPGSGEWWQETWFGGQKSKFVSLGRLTSANGSMRSQIDRLSSKRTIQAISPGRSVAKRAGLTSAMVLKATNSRGATIQAQIDAICAGAVAGKPPAAAVAAAPKRGRKRRAKNE